MPPSKPFSRCLLPLAVSALCLCGSQVFAVDKPSAEKIAQIRAAAEQGDAASQSELAGLYHFGKGVKLDHAEEVKWFRKAADQGFAPAQHNLGICYSEGIGVAKNPVEAFKWYLKAAEQKYLDAQYRVGGCYLEGHGVPRNNQEGAQWLEKAANRGDADAQFQLGRYYDVKSILEQKDYEDNHQFESEYGANFGSKFYIDLYEESQKYAYMWYNLASTSGQSKAKKHLEKLSNRMTPSAISGAQYMSSEWKPVP
jgi:TPR repeat protein